MKCITKTYNDYDAYNKFLNSLENFFSTSSLFFFFLVTFTTVHTISQAIHISLENHCIVVGKTEKLLLKWFLGKSGRRFKNFNSKDEKIEKVRFMYNKILNLETTCSHIQIIKDSTVLAAGETRIFFVKASLKFRIMKFRSPLSRVKPRLPSITPLSITETSARPRSTNREKRKIILTRTPLRG